MFCPRLVCFCLFVHALTPLTAFSQGSKSEGRGSSERNERSEKDNRSSKSEPSEKRDDDSKQGRNEKDEHFKDCQPNGTKRSIYVSGKGSDGNSGKSVKQPLRTLQKAADVASAGDTIWVLDGTYTAPGPANTVLYISKSGTTKDWIRFKAQPGHQPLIKVEDNWGAITIAGAAYIEIDGFEVIGNRKNVSLEYALAQSENLNNPITSGNGISVTNLDGRIGHHIIIRNCHIYDCCGGGIATEQADYIRIENNVVHHNAFYSPYSQSGISMYLNSNYDNLPIVKMIVRNNVCYANQNFVPSFYSGSSRDQRSINDGNGIIIDDTRNVQNDVPTDPYEGYTLVEGNCVYYNGGRGILAYLSDRVFISRNFSFYNAASDSIGSDMFINQCANFILKFNPIIPRPGKIDREVVQSENIVIQH